MTERRFYVAPADMEDVIGGSAVIRQDEHHHLKRVLRLKPGDDVSVFDGEGRGFMGTIESITDDESRVRLVQRDTRVVEPSFAVHLVQGIPNHDQLDLLIQKTTEIGVARIVPVIAERTVLRAGNEGEWKRLPRWRRVATDAARQSGRHRVPLIEAPVTWSEFLEHLPDTPGQVRLILDPDGATMSDVKGLTHPASTQPAMVAVGPEGGWTRREVELGRTRGFIPVTLGPRILRTETAGIVTVALCLFLAGQMGAGSDRA